MARVFLSYERRDSAKAEAIATALEQRGHHVWWDRHIKGGRQFSDEIERALNDAEAVVVLWSCNSVGSDWVRDEAASGRDRRRLVPATIDGTPPPLGFRQYQTLDLSRSPAASIPALSEAIAALAEEGPAEITLQATTSAPWISRRSALLTFAAASACAGGIAYWQIGQRRSPLSPEVTGLLAQAWQAWAQGTDEGNRQAIGLYRRATTTMPQEADIWGFLGCAYGDRGHVWVTGAERDAVWQKAQEAGRHALALDARNAYGRAAVAYARPARGNWALMEREFRRAEADQPGKWLIVYSLALLMGEVGRFSEAARLFGSLKGSAPTATQYHWHIQSLWASGQTDEAERLLRDAVEIYGSNTSIWWQRFDMLLHGGQAAAAIAFSEDRNARPGDIDRVELEDAVDAAKASLAGASTDVNRVIATLRSHARVSAWLAERAVTNACLLGQIDAAFEFADALLFSRGFVVPDFAATAGRAPRTSLGERSPRVLFLPPTRALRSDRRFGQLTERLGLTDYWRTTRTVPDFRLT